MKEKKPKIDDDGLPVMNVDVLMPLVKPPSDESEVPRNGARSGLGSSESLGEYQPMSPGSVASEGNLEPTIADPKSRVGKAHYSGFTEEEARTQWGEETICFTCLSVTVCKIANGIEPPLAAITRCLAYLPMSG